MIGSGRSHIRTVVSIAQAQSLDQEPTPAIKAFASLGTFGKNSSNEERDLHIWLSRIHGIEVQVYHVDFTVQVIWPIFKSSQDSFFLPSTGSSSWGSCFRHLSLNPRFLTRRMRRQFRSLCYCPTRYCMRCGKRTTHR